MATVRRAEQEARGQAIEAARARMQVARASRADQPEPAPQDLVPQPAEKVTNATQEEEPETEVLTPAAQAKYVVEFTTALYRVIHNVDVASVVRRIRRHERTRRVAELDTVIAQLTSIRQQFRGGRKKPDPATVATK